jgi:NarL family two-component system response regulator LiaR
MTIQNSIRVMTVDDHQIFRSGIKFSLVAFDDIELAGEAHSGEEALELCGDLRPDVVLMDMQMGGQDGIASTKAIKEKYPQVQVLMLTTFHDKTLVQQAIKAGAVGYVLKGISTEELANAIRSAAKGQTTLSAEAAQALVQTVSSPPDKPDYGLTRRQQEVLALLVEGLSNPEIADRLVISRHTVRYYVSEVLGKLGVSNRAEAVAMAVKKGLVE